MLTENSDAMAMASLLLVSNLHGHMSPPPCLSSHELEDYQDAICIDLLVKHESPQNSITTSGCKLNFELCYNAIDQNLQ